MENKESYYDLMHRVWLKLQMSTDRIFAFNNEKMKLENSKLYFFENDRWKHKTLVEFRKVELIALEEQLKSISQ